MMKMASKRFGFAALVNKLESLAQVADKEVVELDLFEVFGKNVADDALFLPILRAFGQLAS